MIYNFLKLFLITSSFVAFVYSNELLNVPQRDNNTGIVTDYENKIQWADNVPVKMLKARIEQIQPGNSLGEAYNYCNNLNLDGSGWRLPSLEEFNILKKYIGEKDIFKNQNINEPYLTNTIKGLSEENYQKFLKSNYNPFVITVLYDFEYGRITHYEAYHIKGNVICLRNLIE